MDHVGKIILYKKDAIKRENFELSSNNEKFFMDKNKINRLEGMLLFLAYALYIYLL